MNERDEYYYHKGKLDGYKEGIKAGQKIVTEVLQHQGPAPILVSGKDIDLSDFKIKLAEEKGE